MAVAVPDVVVAAEMPAVMSEEVVEREAEEVAVRRDTVIRIVR